MKWRHGNLSDDWGKNSADASAVNYNVDLFLCLSFLFVRLGGASGERHTHKNEYSEQTEKNNAQQ